MESPSALAARSPPGSSNSSTTQLHKDLQAGPLNTTPFLIFTSIIESRFVASSKIFPLILTLALGKVPLCLQGPVAPCRAGSEAQQSGARLRFKTRTLEPGTE